MTVQQVCSVVLIERRVERGDERILWLAVSSAVAPSAIALPASAAFPAKPAGSAVSWFPSLPAARAGPRAQLELQLRIPLRI